ncbi:MAG: hypothetical protein ONB48_11655 [candidate division KSB1 bacterium]|nr:hypothetical protein [candidate division KSB1 bacterium]MDZ7275390.1 hypothetical protein [candidate division KSB1 bacterium]MDZ7286298.1 hypothetical protein [candidate division KSB1 bacterium]MDZ7296524.1 hypothetical protein [candidate division KSB1 bacterium]MDZ7305517.1 hypothetical protein [candidate division KSB1 bacterium]
MGEPKPVQKYIREEKREKGVMETKPMETKPKRDLAMTMMPYEKVLAQSGGLVLTTHRTRVETQTQITSIMLEELCSCETRFASHPFLLILAGLFALGGLLKSGIGGGEEAITSGFVSALIFVAIYFATRKAVITLASAGARINLERKK